MNVCWYTRSLLVYGLCIYCSLYAGRIYYFDKDLSCKAIDAAPSLRELVPFLAHQVKVHIYCAERSCGQVLEVKQKSEIDSHRDDDYKKDIKDKDDIHNAEFFFQEWDEPLVAAGMHDELFVRLEKWIDTLDVRNVPERLKRKSDEALVQKKFFEQFNKVWWEREALPSSDSGSFEELTKQLEDLSYKKFYEKIVRKKEIKDFLRVWLMKRGKLPGLSPSRSCLKQEGVVDTLKKELLEGAHELRWEHERQAHGIKTFVQYLDCCDELHTLSDERLESFCLSLAGSINSHFDLYGVPSTLSLDYHVKETLPYIKDLAKDNTERFHKLLAMSFVKVVERCNAQEELQGLNDGSLDPRSVHSVAPKNCYGEDGVLVHNKTDLSVVTRIFPYLTTPTAHLLARREQCIAPGIQARLDEKLSAVHGSFRNRKPLTPTSSTPRSKEWCPFTKAEEIWNRFQLIDEIRLGVDPVCVTDVPGGESIHLSPSSASLGPIVRSLRNEALPANVFMTPPTSHDESISLSVKDKIAKTVLAAQQITHEKRLSPLDEGTRSTKKLLSPPPAYSEPALPPYDNSWAFGGH